jgi:hypothetical protein
MFASGVILSGAITSTNLFFRLSPVSFYLAQCASFSGFPRCHSIWLNAALTKMLNFMLAFYERE